MRDVKVEEFINLNQGSVSVEEYSFKFTLFCSYAPSLVSNPRDYMISLWWVLPDFSMKSVVRPCSIMT